MLLGGFAYECIDALKLCDALKVERMGVGRVDMNENPALTMGFR